MPGIARVGIDTAGGLILGGGQSKYFVNNVLAAVVGDAVASHGLSPHASAVMVEGSPNVFVNNIPVCREGDLASCGDAATGSSDTFAN